MIIKILRERKISWANNRFTEKQYTILNNGVTKSIAEAWWSKNGNFNGQLYDQLMRAKQWKL